METQTFEELEGIDLEKKKVESKPELKEYEKLLLAEANREAFEKAVTLLTYGCFTQEQKPTVDFSKLVKVDGGRKYKGLYSLYQSNETGELIFVCPLVENNKGDEKEERKNMAPYAYDCITIESMDDESYEAVKKAAKNNIRTVVSVLVAVTWSVFFFMVLLGVVVYVYWAIQYSTQSYSWDVCMFSAISQVAGIITGEIVGLPLLTLMTIKYKKYKEQ